MADRTSQFNSEYRPFRLEVKGCLRMTSALHIGAGGNWNPATDAAIVRSGGIPYIPGSSLRGILWHHLWREHPLLGLEKTHFHRLFGEVLPERSTGREAIAGQSMSGRLVIEDAWPTAEAALPSEARDFVRIDRHTGAAANQGKFDSEVLLAENQLFSFALAYEGESPEDGELLLIEEAIRRLCSGELRIGAYSGKGFGRLSLVENGVEYFSFDRRNMPDLAKYLSGRLGSQKAPAKMFGWPKEKPPLGAPHAQSSIEFDLQLQFSGPMLVKSPIPPPPPPGQGFNPDHIPLNRLSDGKQYLPGASLRGVLRSRAEYIWGAREASRLFGEEIHHERETGQKGLLEVSDGELSTATPVYVDLDHVAIDRLTNAAASGAKFAARALASPAFNLKLRIQFGPAELAAAWMLGGLLLDLTNGRLWAGGGVTRGYGYISGAAIQSCRVALVESHGNGYVTNAPGSRTRGRIEWTSSGNPAWKDLQWLWVLLDNAKLAPAGSAA